MKQSITFFGVGSHGDCIVDPVDPVDPIRVSNPFFL